MSEPGYEILSIDDLDQFPDHTGTQILMPVRRRLGFEPFGINAWLGREPGDTVIERHSEPKGPEELYVVLRGRASFTLGEETFEAPVGTLVHAPPDTLREATAIDPGTVVLAAGAKAGETFAPSQWEDFAVAFGKLRAGDREGWREAVELAIARDPEAWQGVYNAACLAALGGDRDAAVDYLRRAVAAGGDEVRTYASTDADFDSIRDDPLYREALA